VKFVDTRLYADPGHRCTQADGCAHLRRAQAVMMAPGDCQQVATESLREIRPSVLPVEAAGTAVLVAAVPKVCLLLLVCIPLLVREHDVQIHL